MAKTKKLRIITNGLSGIVAGQIPEDGTMCPDDQMEQLGYTYQDSCTLTEEDPETNEFYAEEVDDPIFVSDPKDGKKTLTFSIPDPSVETIAMLKGGTYQNVGDTVGDGEEETTATDTGWYASDNAPSVELAFKITAKTGYTFYIPRAKVVAKFNAEFKKAAVVLLEVTATVMQPINDDVPKLYLLKK